MIPPLAFAATTLLVAPVDAPVAGPPVALWTNDGSRLHYASAFAFTTDGAKLVVVAGQGDSPTTCELRVYDSVSGRQLYRQPAVAGPAARVSGAVAASRAAEWAVQPFGDQLRTTRIPNREGSRDNKDYQGHRIGQATAVIAVGSSDETAYSIVLPSDSPYRLVLQYLADGPRPAVVIRGTSPAQSAAIDVAANRFVAAAGPRLGAPSVPPHMECWDLAGKPLCAIPVPARIASVAIAPGGKLVAAGRSDGLVSCYSLPDGKLVVHSDAVQAERYTVQAVAFHPAGSYLICGTTGSRGKSNLFLIEFASGKVLRAIDADDSGLCALAFSPDGKRLATFGGSGALKLWDADALLKPAK